MLGMHHAPWLCYDERRELENGELINEARLFLVLFLENLTRSLTRSMAVTIVKHRAIFLYGIVNTWVKEVKLSQEPPWLLKIV